MVTQIKQGEFVVVCCVTGSDASVEKNKGSEKPDGDTKGQSKHQTPKGQELEQLLKRLNMNHWLQGNWEKASNCMGDAKLAKGAEGSKLSIGAVNQFYKRAEEIFNSVTALHDKKQKKDSDEHFLKTILKTGTQKDKLAAIVIRISEAPLFRLGQTQGLLDLAQKNHRTEATMAMDSFKDLCGSVLLPDRRLTAFADRPLNDSRVKDEDLFYWYFEDKIKNLYKNFIGVVEKASHDSVVIHRTSMLRILQDMVTNKKEGEKQIIAAVINKLGDHDKSVASKAVYVLNQLSKLHPGMRLHFAKEIEDFILRSNTTATGQYYSVIYLNQTVMHSGEDALARKLIEIYFKLFDSLNNRQNMREGRAIKSSKSIKYEDEEEKQNPSKKKKKFVKKTPVQELEQELDDKIRSQIMVGVRRAFPYAPFEEEVFQAHLNNLYRYCHGFNFDRTVQAAMLILLVESTRGDITPRFFKMMYDRILFMNSHTATAHTQFLNILYKIMKVDGDDNRVRAFVKRLLQMCALAEPEVICASLVLVSSILKSKPACASLINLTEETARNIRRKEDDKFAARIVDDDEEEKFVDVKEEGQDYRGKDKAKVGEEEPDLNRKPTFYDPYKRDPQYSGAESTCLWEAIPLVQHYHPSVSTWAKLILNGKFIEYSGDPITDFSRSIFLDRFSFKNPKTKTSNYASIMARQKEPSVDRVLQPNQLIKQAEDKVKPEDRFMYNYYTVSDSQSTTKPKKKRVEDEFDPDAPEVDDDAFDEYILKSKNTGLEDSRMEIDEDDLESDEEAAFAEAFGKGGQEEDVLLDDGETGGASGQFFDDEEEDDLDEALMGDEEVEDGEDGGQKSVYADADDFADILSSAGSDYSAGVHKKQVMQLLQIA
ncbi:ribosome biogenesis protein MAK21 [Planoprotostelium fungivorum]|uniref:Ribosome biogenesis protein MAK21 n=1 Tax=Planoprotostelium fungivorum TaxID=1890364 RepID=A0A2P6NQF4_9EUKA|nr:ribosome biogenesis protein MAK21 [Planoprotostelium fungivorum]